MDSKQSDARVHGKTVEAAPRDEITVFLGEMPPEEYELRDKLRSYRNTACAVIAQTRSDTARALAWFVLDWAVPWLYQSEASLEWLDQLNRLSKRLLLTAMQVEVMDGLLQEVARDGS